MLEVFLGVCGGLRPGRSDWWECGPGRRACSMLTSSADVVTMPSVPSVGVGPDSLRDGLSFMRMAARPLGCDGDAADPLEELLAGRRRQRRSWSFARCLGWVEHQYFCSGVGGHEGEGMELEDERFPRGGGRCDDDVLAGSGQVEGPALVVPDGVEGMDAGGAGGDEVGR